MGGDVCRCVEWVGGGGEDGGLTVLSNVTRFSAAFNAVFSACSASICSCSRALIAVPSDIQDHG